MNFNMRLESELAKAWIGYPVPLPDAVTLHWFRLGPTPPDAAKQHQHPSSASMSLSPSPSHQTPVASGTDSLLQGPSNDAVSSMDLLSTPPYHSRCAHLLRLSHLLHTMRTHTIDISKISHSRVYPPRIREVRSRSPTPSCACRHIYATPSASPWCTPPCAHCVWPTRLHEA